MPKHSYPLWTLPLPLIGFAAYIMARTENRLWATLVSASVYTMMQWLLPKCRFRPDAYFSPVNLAMILMLLKLVAVPSLIMLVGPDTPLMIWIPSLSSMNAALLIDTVTFVALGLGLTFTTKASQTSTPSLPTPSPALIAVYAALGLIALAAVFGSVGRLIEYFVEPSAIVEIAQAQQGTVAGVIGTFFRPFLAFSLAAWWSRVVDRDRPVWQVTLAGIFAAFVITLANATYSFNRAAFVFPVIALAAVYHNRIRRIPLALIVMAGAVLLPALIVLFTYRSNMLVGSETQTPSAMDLVYGKINDNLQAYAVGPQYTGVFYDRIGWGDKLYYGSTLLSSSLSPIPVLGKAFRDDNGPALFNRALYGINGIEDQILPFNAELFANFHGLGVVLGYIGLGFLIGKLDQWILAAGSSFTAFAFQYAGIWTAMLTTWSLSIYSQILIYFFGPVYVYVALVHLRQWLRRSAAEPAAGGGGGVNWEAAQS